VLDAATELLDAAGIDAVTMRGLGERLGVSPMALYRYVGDRDDLLVALIDRLAARLQFPPRPDDPVAALIVLFSTLYDGLAEHPWLVEVLSRRRMIAPSVLGAIEEIHAALCAAGLSIEEAVQAYRVIWQFTIGALLVRAGASAAGASQQSQVRGAPDAERYPTLARAAAGWTAAHGRDMYRDDVDVLVRTVIGRP
jgi:AcrR family transcriptional regulator